MIPVTRYTQRYSQHSSRVHNLPTCILSLALLKQKQPLSARTLTRQRQLLSTAVTPRCTTIVGSFPEEIHCTQRGPLHTPQISRANKTRFYLPLNCTPTGMRQLTNSPPRGKNEPRQRQVVRGTPSPSSTACR